MLTQELVKELFDYNPHTGILTWKIKPSRKVQVGDIAGSVDAGEYLVTWVKGKSYKNHRICFLWYHGYLPKYLDHKDTIRSHNWIDNLRECTYSQNGQNRKLNKNNTSGVKGVFWHKSSKKWCARLMISGKNHCLGYFKELSDAESAVKTARIKHCGEFANHGER